MLAKKYKSKIISIENLIEGVYTLEFAADRGKYKYLPGQFLHLAIEEEYDGIGQWPDSRCFSMQSHPDQEAIKITYAVKGSFTRQMEATLKTGSKVWLKLPYGDLFTQKHRKENTVFIAGGTGITPFLSLFSGKSFKDYDHPVLYAGFRNEQLNIYTDELKVAQVNNRNFEINFTYEGVEGLLDINKILGKSDKKSSFFISGPPIMIKLFKKELINSGIHENQILTDEWD